MSASRRERKLQRAARERTQRIFERVFAPTMDGMEPVARMVLRFCGPIVAAAAEQPRKERFRWFLEQLPNELLESMSTLIDAMALEPEEEEPALAPVLVTFMRWARMLLYGRPEEEWRVATSLNAEVEGLQRVLMLTQMERVRRMDAFETYEYPADPWDEEAVIHAEGRREEVFERIRQEDEAARAADPDWRPPLDRTQLPFKIADDLEEL